MQRKSKNKRVYITIATRRQIKVEAGHKCGVCRMNTCQHLHHIDSDPANDNSENLIYLCGACHHDATYNGISVQEMLIYKKKLQKENDKIIKLKRENDILKQKLTEGAIQTKDKKFKSKFSRLLMSLTNEFFYYQVYIYLLSPFYIDKRGDEARKKLRNLLKITKKEEDLLLEKLEQSKSIEKTGGIVSLKDKSVAEETLNYLLIENKIDLDKITKLFLE